MTIGLPAYHNEVYSVEKNCEDINLAVRTTLKELQWKYIETSKDTLVASSKISFESFGEKVTIQIMSKDSISITSKCKHPIQWLDFGRNKRNVDKFLLRLKQHV